MYQTRFNAPTDGLISETASLEVRTAVLRLEVGVRIGVGPWRPAPGGRGEPQRGDPKRDACQSCSKVCKAWYMFLTDYCTRSWRSALLERL